MGVNNLFILANYNTQAIFLGGKKSSGSTTHIVSLMLNISMTPLPTTHPAPFFP